MDFAPVGPDLDDIIGAVVERIEPLLSQEWETAYSMPDVMPSHTFLVECNQPVNNKITLDPRYGEYPLDLTFFVSAGDPDYALKTLRRFVHLSGPFWRAFQEPDQNDALGRMTSYTELSITNQLAEITLNNAPFKFLMMRLAIRA